MRVHPIDTICPLVLFGLLVVVPTSFAQSGIAEQLPARPLPSSAPIQLIEEPHVIVVTQQQIEELAQWTRAFTDWQKWADRWLNRRQPGKWSYLVERQKRPDPPAWLHDTCELLGDDSRLAEACDLLVAWRDDPIATKNRQTTNAAMIHEESPAKSSWLQHVHVDGLWSTTQSNMNAFGLFGAHVTVDVKGRVQVFVVPGILLVSVPQFLGRRELWPATDWGMSYRLFSAGRSTVRFNLVHAWMLANRASAISPNLTLAGFSVSFKPRPH
jgi:hypothetical protein